MLTKILNLKILSLGFLCLMLTGCQSATFPDVQTLLINLSSSFPPLWHLVTGAAYVFGMGFLLRGVYALKIYGEGRTQMSGSTSLKGPLLYFLVGTALMFFPTTKGVLMQTIFSYSQEEPLSYVQNPVIGDQVMGVILQFVQLVGLIGFVRGWFYLAQLASPGGSGQHSFGKSMTHIFGGILAINIEGVREVLMNTFGIGAP